MLLPLVIIGYKMVKVFESEKEITRLLELEKNTNKKIFSDETRKIIPTNFSKPGEISYP
jgi:hypothetical protein